MVSLQYGQVSRESGLFYQPLQMRQRKLRQCQIFHQAPAKAIYFQAKLIPSGA